MRSYGVVVPAPSVEDAPGILDAGKPVFVEALIAELAIEALDVRVLGRFSGSDEVDTHSVLVGSLKNLTSEQFATQHRNTALSQKLLS